MENSNYKGKKKLEWITTHKNLLINHNHIFVTATYKLLLFVSCIQNNIKLESHIFPTSCFCSLSTVWKEKWSLAEYFIIGFFTSIFSVLFLFYVACLENIFRWCRNEVNVCLFVVRNVRHGNPVNTNNKTKNTT